MIDFLMDWEDAAYIVKTLGWDAWVEHVGKAFPRRELFNSTMDWFRHGPEYVAKLKGVRGDVIVGWKHDH